MSWRLLEGRMGDDSSQYPSLYSSESSSPSHLHMTYSRHRCKHTMWASPTGRVLPLDTGFELFIVRETPSPTVDSFLHEGGLPLKLPILRFPVIVFRLWVSTLSLGWECHRNAVSIVAARNPILSDWRLLVSHLRRHAVAQHIFDGDSQPPRFHPVTQPKG